MSLGDLILVFSKLIYTSSPVPTKIPAGFFLYRKTISCFYMDMYMEIQRVKAIFKRVVGAFT